MTTNNYEYGGPVLRQRPRGFYRRGGLRFYGRVAPRRITYRQRVRRRANARRQRGRQPRSVNRSRTSIWQTVKAIVSGFAWGFASRVVFDMIKTTHF